jgi:hypothetical protein
MAAAEFDFKAASRNARSFSAVTDPRRVPTRGSGVLARLAPRLRGTVVASPSESKSTVTATAGWRKTLAHQYKNPANGQFLGGLEARSEVTDLSRVRIPPPPPQRGAARPSGFSLSLLQTLGLSCPLIASALNRSTRTVHQRKRDLDPQFASGFRLRARRPGERANGGTVAAGGAQEAGACIASSGAARRVPPSGRLASVGDSIGLPGEPRPCGCGVRWNGGLGELGERRFPRASSCGWARAAPR